MGKYAECAHRAIQEMEQDSSAYQECRHPANMLLLLFLGHCKDKHAGEIEPSRMAGTLHKTFASVRNHTSRIHNIKQLKSLHGAGPTVCAMVSDNLWKVCEPEPASQEEQALEARQKEALQLEKEREKERAKKRKAEGKAAAAEAAARQAYGGGAGPDPLMGGRFDENREPCSSPGDADDELAGQAKKKKAKTAKGRKEYIPNKGDANWVVVLMLLKHCRNGTTFMTKSDLCVKAEASGLLKPGVSMHPPAAASARPGQMQANYCGWSSFKTLVNREPPWCFAYSQPKKVQLTNEGEAMAVRLYKDAVRSGFLDWRIPDIPLDSEGTSQPASSPALPHAQAVPSRPPSQAFRPSQGSHSQHLQSSSSLPRSNGQSHHRGRAFEPAGPSNSPSAAGWNPPSSSGARPNPSSVSEVNRLQCDLLVHPSSSFRGVPDEEQDLSLSQRLSQGQSCTQTLSQSASRPLHGRPSPTAEQPAVKSRREEDILQIVQITDCSYAKAQRMMADGSSVNRAIEKIVDSEDSGDDDLIQLRSKPSSSQMPGDLDIPMGSQPSTSQMPGDWDIPTGASQSNPLSQPLPAPGSQQGRRPCQKRPPKSAPGLPLLPHPASLNVESMSQSQHLNHEQPSRQGSGSLGGGLGRAGSLGAVGPSRLGAAGQGRASGCSQQGSQGAGHIEAAHLESSGMSWQLPFLGAAGSIEEQNIRIPPLSAGCCFSDEYELVLIIDSREQYSHVAHSKVEGLARHVQLVMDRNIPVEVRGLQQGDALWIAKSRKYSGVEYVMDYILERKRVDDLHQSIKDRRYDKQKYNMQRCGLRHLIYLVEGDPDTLGDETGIKAVKTATVQTEVIDGFQILRSRDCTLTMQSLAAWTKALKRKYDHLTETHPQIQRFGDPLPTFDAFKAKSAKMQSKTVQDVWGLMLTSVPGWSGTMVEAVVKQYGTPLLLYRAYQQAMQSAPRQGRDCVEAARQLLVSCQLSQNRRPISANNSAKVFDLLFANGWHVV